MKIRVETKYGNYEIERHEEDMNIHEMMDIFQDLLLSMGYHIDSIKDGFNEKSEEYIIHLDEETE